MQRADGAQRVQGTTARRGAPRAGGLGRAGTVALRAGWLSRAGVVALLVGLAALVASGLAGPQTVAAQRPRLRMAVLSFPAISTFVGAVIREAGIDRAHGLELENVPYATISAYYAAIATGEVDMLGGGPNVLQRMRLEGVPVRAVATLIRPSDLVLIARHPELRGVTDLKGRTLAADMGSQQFLLLAIYARWKGLDLRRDVTIVQAPFPLARAQLAAGRVDAAMLIEPVATLAMRDSTAYRIIFNGRRAWREMTGNDGWELIVWIRDDVVRRAPAQVDAVVKMLTGFQEFVRTNLDEADRIVARTTGLPAGAFKEAVLYRRLQFEVYPAWGRERGAIEQMFRLAVEAGVVERLPDAGVIYRP
ncbi:MAG: ABC transporter substrate-binding protein [Armatimonadota bacterium]|nr:ABC transporter substrate-binding protein [Armatimonadota bacterium]MDR7532048.1 ABC transporter substrate-binding protein [Armatimonadota bacterium]MDR7535979.1 ABC transporter substrate-binding protein [Armatimonadota bacterium]